MTTGVAAIVLGWQKILASLDHLLSKGLEYAEATGTPEQEMLEWRLAPDMYPLRHQAQFVCNLVRQWAARAAGSEPGNDIGGDCGLDRIRAEIADVRIFLAGLEPDRFPDCDDRLLTVDLTVMSPTLPVAQWITGFATTNIIFHLTTLYAILRSRGVPLGKADLFAGGL